jgi:hypothetical protein
MGVDSAKRWLRPVLGALAAGFVGFAAYDLAQRWDGARVEVEWAWVALALPLVALAGALQVLAWAELVRGFGGRRMPWWPAAALYCDAQLARYTPGKLGLPAVRLAGAARVGVSPRVMGGTLLVEVASWNLTGGVVGLSVLLLAERRAPGAGGVLLSRELARLFSGGALLVVAGSLLGLSLACALPRRRWPERVLCVLGVEPSERPERALVPLQLPALHALHWLAWCGAGASLGVALGAPLPQSLALGALVPLAIVLGALALFAPAGAGVREAVLGLGAAPLLGAPAGLALGVLARGLSLLSDVALWALARLVVAQKGAGRPREAAP